MSGSLPLSYNDTTGDSQAPAASEVVIEQSSFKFRAYRRALSKITRQCITLYNNTLTKCCDCKAMMG